ncbi:MAG: hypothetical protein ACRDZW_08510 [Acidimicrobiales bacterium]
MRLDDFRRHRQTLTAIAAVVAALAVAATVTLLASSGDDDGVLVNAGAPDSTQSVPTTAEGPTTTGGGLANSTSPPTTGPVPTTLPPSTATTTTAVPTTAPPFAAFDPLAYDRTATLAQEFESGASGFAGARRLDATTWRVTVVARGLAPGASHSVLVHRPPPDQGTPFPTACSFAAGADGNGTCTGDIWMAEGVAPDNLSVLAGRAVASGPLV